MKAKFKKEEDKLVIISESLDVSNIIENLINELFLDVEIHNNKFIMEANLINLELFNTALTEKGVNVELTEKMKSALNAVKDNKKNTENTESKVIKIKSQSRKSTRRGGTNVNEKDSSEIKSLTLTKLFSRIKQAIEINLPNEIWLEAEIANLNKSPKGHYYLDLIETDFNGNEIAKNKAIIWSSTANAIDNKFKEGTGSSLNSGQKVLLKVKVTFETRFGLNLSVVDINPSFTLGDMDAKIMKIINQLKQENIFDLNKRITIPYIFKKLAVISPEEAAGLKDFQVDAERLDKNGICEFDYYQAFFQGKDVKDSILKAFCNIEKSGEDYDAIIIIRGGGAKTDLHYLNEYDIAKKICESKLPVIVGIGHQIDHGILDDVACIKQDTPSKVIGYIYTSLQDRYKLLSESRGRILQNLANFIQVSKNNIENKNASNKAKVQNHLTIYKTNVEQKRNFINQTLMNSINILKNDLINKRNGLPKQINDVVDISKKIISDTHKDVASTLLNSTNNLKRQIDKSYFYISQFNPKELFKKGFSVALSKKDKPIESVNDVKNGDSIKIYLQDGSINTKVESKNE